MALFSPMWLLLNNCFCLSISLQFIEFEIWLFHEFSPGCLCKGEETKWLQSIHGCHTWSKSTQPPSQSCSCWVNSWVCSQFDRLFCIPIASYWSQRFYKNRRHVSLLWGKATHAWIIVAVHSTLPGAKTGRWLHYFCGSPADINDLNGNMFSLHVIGLTGVQLGVLMDLIVSLLEGCHTIWQRFKLKSCWNHLGNSCLSKFSSFYTWSLSSLYWLFGCCFGWVHC